MRAKYINPFTDFGFKKIFGEEASKPLLMDFLNSLLPQANKITNLSFKNTEQLGLKASDRKAIYDIYCEAEDGEKFIVELQKAKQNYFRERTIYYSTFPIRDQADKGDWNYDLKSVYCIGILDFIFTDYKSESDKGEVVHIVQLKDQNCRVFYEKLTYIYLEMPNFDKSESELETRLDKWLYFIRNLEDFQSIPQIFRGEIVFEQAFAKAELAKLDNTEQDQYEYSLKVFRDLKNTYDYAVQTAREEGLQQGKEEGLQQGIEQGKEEGKIEMARQAKLIGLSTEDIIKLTGLSAAEIDAL